MINKPIQSRKQLTNRGFSRAVSSRNKTTAIKKIKGNIKISKVEVIRKSTPKRNGTYQVFYTRRKK